MFKQIQNNFQKFVILTNFITQKGVVRQKKNEYMHRSTQNLKFKLCSQKIENVYKVPYKLNVNPSKN